MKITVWQQWRTTFLSSPIRLVGSVDETRKLENDFIFVIKIGKENYFPLPPLSCFHISVWIYDRRHAWCSKGPITFSGEKQGHRRVMESIPKSYMEIPWAIKTSIYDLCVFLWVPHRTVGSYLTQKRHELTFANESSTHLPEIMILCTLCEEGTYSL